MKDKRLRRRCNSCKKRVNLKIVRRGKNLFLKCPNCLAEARYFNQKNYEKRKSELLH